MEAKVQQQYYKRNEFSIDNETLCWVWNLRSTRARETKYAKTLDLYWHMKYVLLPMTFRE